MEEREDKKEISDTPENRLLENANETMYKGLGFKYERVLPTYPISKKIPKKLADMLGK